MDRESYRHACVDSRLLGAGDLFFATKGERRDGHDFVEEVAARGAVGAVVSQEFSREIENFLLIRVDDPLLALQDLAREYLKTHPARIVGITGSLGKTTTKTFLHTLLEEKFSVASSPGNYNSQIGLPLAVLNHTKGDEEVLLLEMGMTHPGEIARLVEIAPPDIALVTTIDQVHRAFFSSEREIALAKGEIFSHSQTQLGLFPQDTGFRDIFEAVGSCVKQMFVVDPEVDLPVLGLHNRHNFAAAAAVARALGMTNAEIEQRIPHLQLPERRLQQVEKRGVLFINDSYNACVSSMKAALDALPEPHPGGKRVAVLGGMVELGEKTDEAHREVGEYALTHVDELLCLHESCLPMVSSWKQAGRNARMYPDRQSLTAALKCLVEPGDVVLVKGSNARGLWTVLEEF